MSKFKRCERVSFETIGYNLVGREELAISVKNISLTGFLATIEPTILMPTVRELFQGIREHKFIEFNLIELNISGICTMVWSKTVESHFLTGFEFYESKYERLDVESKRRYFRTKKIIEGIIEYEGFSYNFTTNNTSPLGMMVLINGPSEFEKGKKVKFEIKTRNMSGVVKVVWFKYDAQCTNTLMGLEFVTISTL